MNNKWDISIRRPKRCFYIGVSWLNSKLTFSFIVSLGFWQIKILKHKTGYRHLGSTEKGYKFFKENCKEYL